MNQRKSKKIIPYAISISLGVTMAVGLSGCGEQGSQNAENSISQAAEQGLFLMITQTGANPDTYELTGKYPSNDGKTSASLTELDGNQRMLSEAELTQIAEAEAAKFEAGESALNQPAMESGGLSLGEMILASAAGSLIGGMIANKMAGNSNFQQHQQQQNQRAQRNMRNASKSMQSKPASSSRATSGSRSKPSSGLFGSKRRSSGFGGGRRGRR